MFFPLTKISAINLAKGPLSVVQRSSSAPGVSGLRHVVTLSEDDMRPPRRERTAFRGPFAKFIALIFASFAVVGLVSSPASAQFSTANLFESDATLLLMLEQLKIPLRPEWKTLGPVEVSSPATGNRLVQKFTLQPEGLGTVKLAVSFPASYRQNPNQQFPVLVVLGGMQTGPEVIQLVEKPGNNAIVGFEYPIKMPQSAKHFDRSIRNALTTPINISMLMNWINEQPWADRRRINIMGVSFGAFMLPLSLRFSQLTGVRPRTAVLAYGGADLKHFAKTSLAKEMGQTERRYALEALSLLTDVYDPKTHLPKINNVEFLIVNGTEDEVIPKESTAALNNIVPAPKDIIEISGAHIGTERKSIIQALVQSVYTWLLDNQAINR